MRTWGGSIFHCVTVSRRLHVERCGSNIPSDFLTHPPGEEQDEKDAQTGESAPYSPPAV